METIDYIENLIKNIELIQRSKMVWAAEASMANRKKTTIRVVKRIFSLNEEVATKCFINYKELMVKKGLKFLKECWKLAKNRPSGTCVIPFTVKNASIIDYLKYLKISTERTEKVVFNDKITRQMLRWREQPLIRIGCFFNELIDKEVDLLNNGDLSVRKKGKIIIYFNPIFFKKLDTCKKFPIENWEVCSFPI